MYMYISFFDVGIYSKVFMICTGNSPLLKAHGYMSAAVSYTYFFGWLFFFLIIKIILCYNGILIINAMVVVNLV